MSPVAIDPAFLAASTTARASPGWDEEADMNQPRPSSRDRPRPRSPRTSSKRSSSDRPVPRSPPAGRSGAPTPRSSVRLVLARGAQQSRGHAAHRRPIGPAVATFYDMLETRPRPVHATSTCCTKSRARPRRGRVLRGVIAARRKRRQTSNVSAFGASERATSRDARPSGQ